MTDSIISKDEAIAKTRIWLERAVLGLKLCPFARAPYEAGRVQFVVIEAREEQDLRDTFETHACDLLRAPVDAVETTLLIYPRAMESFLEFMSFAQRAGRVLQRLGLEGTFQLVPFHPGFQFDDQPEDAIENYSNRSPLPVLQLLREDSVERAIAAFGEPQQIYQRNVRTLQGLGHAGWRELW